MREPLDVAAELRGEHLLVTGATGFVGKVLVEKLLWSVPEVGGLSLLIRGDGGPGAAGERLDREIARSPLAARLRARHGEGWQAWLEDKVEVVDGDLALPRFGLGEAAWEDLCRRVDRVVACAATVRFDERLDRALAVNVRGALHTLELAREAGDVPLVHVSTCFVSTGCVSGGRRGEVPESLPDDGDDGSAVLAELEAASRRGLEAAGEGPEADVVLVAAGAEQAGRHGFPDVYTLTKALAERLLAARRGDVPLAVVRPAIVESAHAEPLAGWLQAVRVVDPLLVAYGRGLARELPGAPDLPLEVVPVDFVANAILAALARLSRDRAGAGPEARVYQVGSARHRLTLGELLRHAREGFARSPLHDAEGAPIRPPAARFRDPEELHRRLGARLRRVRRLAGALRAVGAGRRAARLAVAERRLEHFRRLVEVYRPYLSGGATYLDAKTRELWRDLSPRAREEFPFDVTALDWADYLVRSHVPGLVRFALRAEAGTAGPATGEPVEPREEQVDEAVERAAGAGNLHDLLAAVAAARPEAVFVQTYRDGAWLRYTYRQAETAVAHLAWRLAAEHGVGRGDRVVLCSGGCPEWVIAAFACFRLGAVAVPLDPQWPAPEVAEAARRVGASLVCAAPALVSALREELAADPPIPSVALAATFVPEPGVALPPAATLPPGPAAGEADLATILFTSGTTVAPKAVPLTHGNYLANVRDLVPLMELTGERLLSVLPVHHAFEQTVGLLVPMAGASAVSYLTEVRPEEIRWTMAATRPTVMVAVPRLLDLLHAGIRRSVDEGGPALRGLFAVLFALSRVTGGRWGHRLFAKVHRRFGGSLRRIACGGSALDPRLGESFRLMGFRVAEGYGMTETSPVLTVNPWGALRFGSVGRPLPGVEIELRRPADDGAAAGSAPGEGEVWVRGANVMAGYLDDPAASSEVLADGWLATGDLGRFDADGYLHLCGRSKDVIVTAAGKNVYPEEVERRYQGVEGVEELVVLGLPAAGGPGAGEVVGGVVVPSVGADGLDALRAAFAERSAQIPSYQRITRLVGWRGPLPKTTTMKVRRRLLREAVVAGELGAAPVEAPGAAAAAAVPPSGPQAPPDGDTAFALDLLARLTHTRPDRLTPETRLADLGLDSLGHAELVGALEARTGRRLEASAVGGTETIGEILRRL